MHCNASFQNDSVFGSSKTKLGFTNWCDIGLMSCTQKHTDLVVGVLQFLALSKRTGTAIMVSESIFGLWLHLWCTTPFLSLEVAVQAMARTGLESML